jgi:putative aldouronate transport system substrate-binding protein
MGLYKLYRRKIMKERRRFNGRQLKKMVHLILMTLVLGGVTFAGGKRQQNSSESTFAAYSGSLPFVSLKYYDIGDKLPGLDMVLKEMNVVLRERLNCELNVEYLPWDGLTQKYPLVFAAGESFDCIFASSWSQYGTMAIKNAFMELTPDMIQKNAPFVWSAIPQEGWDQVRVKGKIFMVPHTTKEFNQYVVGIRGSLREKYGLPPIRSYADLENYLAAVKKNEPDLLPLSITMNGQGAWACLWNYMHDRFVLGEISPLYYVNINDPASKVLSFLEQPDAVEYVTMMTRWQRAGYISRNALSSWQLSVDDFENGIAAACMGNQGTVEKSYIRDTDYNNGAWKVEFYDLTEYANKKVAGYPYNTGGIAINRTSKNPERVLMMVDLFRKDRDLNNLAQRGIRGIHWDYESDGTTIRGDWPPVPENMIYGGAITWGPFRNVQFQVHYNNKTSPYYRHIFESSVSRELIIPAGSFIFDDTQVKTEEASVADVYQQYVVPLMLGFDDPSNISAINQRLKSAGIDKLIAEREMQLNANK